MGDGIETSIQGESVLEYVHKRNNKTIGQGFTEYGAKCDKIIYIDYLNKTVTENITYHDNNKSVQVKQSGNIFKYWLAKCKLWKHNLLKGV